MFAVCSPASLIIDALLLSVFVRLVVGGSIVVVAGAALVLWFIVYKLFRLFKLGGARV